MPPIMFWRIVGQASIHTARGSGPSTIERSSLRAGRVAVAMGEENTEVAPGRLAEKPLRQLDEPLVAGCPGLSQDPLHVGLERGLTPAIARRLLRAQRITNIGPFDERHRGCGVVTG